MSRMNSVFAHVRDRSMWYRDGKGGQMDFKPYYGIRLLKEGFSSAVALNFYDFRLYSLTVIGRGQYSTMVEMPYAGESHALSLDFDQRQLDQILAKKPFIPTR